MSLPKIFDFNNYNHYPTDPQPTTDADMQDYFENQNKLLTAATKRLWQPETAYKVGDIVASPDMADGLVAVCVAAGTTSDVEPAWGVNEATVIDNACIWTMRIAYSYALATNDDIDNAYDGNSVEASRLLSLGIFSRLMHCVEQKIKLLAYPVGSIYMSMNATNPATLFGGTWEQIAQGRCLIGAGTGKDSRNESKTFKAGDTGGEYNHQLTVGELALHTHSASISNTGSHTHKNGNIVPTSGGYLDVYGSQGYSNDTCNTGRRVSGDTSGSGFKYAITSLNGAQSNTATISSTGSNNTHNNIQPYFVCYTWRRTA